MGNRPGWENAPRCAGERTRVLELAKSDLPQAHRIARGISLHWYAAQALSKLAEAAPEETVADLLAEAISRAEADSDTYRRIAVKAYIIDAALKRGRTALAEHLLAAATSQVALITPAKSRVTAMEDLLARSIKVGPPHTEQLATALFDTAAILTADPFKKWQKWGRTAMNRPTHILATDHRPLVTRLLTAHLGPDKAAGVLDRHGTPATAWR